MKHVMLDLETWGTSVGSALRSIGMVQFDPRHAGFGKEFYCNLEFDDQKELGATVDESTVKWWNLQGKEATEVLQDNQLKLEDACNKVREFFYETKVAYVWAQGSNFDPVLLEQSFKFAKVKVPWRFYNTRDTRTCYNMTELNTNLIKRQGTYHNALDDAKHQVRCVYKSYQIMDSKT